MLIGFNGLIIGSGLVKKNYKSFTLLKNACSPVVILNVLPYGPSW